MSTSIPPNRVGRRNSIPLAPVEQGERGVKRKISSIDDLNWETPQEEEDLNQGTQQLSQESELGSPPELIPIIKRTKIEQAPEPKQEQDEVQQLLGKYRHTFNAVEKATYLRAVLNGKHNKELNAYIKTHKLDFISQDAKGRRPLFIAAYNGKLNVVEFLVLSYLTTIASPEDRHALLKIVLEKAVEGSKHVSDTADCPHLEIVKHLIGNFTKDKKDQDFLRRLLSIAKGLDITKKGHKSVIEYLQNLFEPSNTSKKAI
ncbi:MAG: ankyrin repeat domain-containing protein [Bdellovibrionota bacterium]